MDHHSRRSVLALGWLMLIMAMFGFAQSGATDIECLKSIKQSVDPHNKLSDWVFNNSSIDVICSFSGVGCWSHGPPGFVMTIELGGRGLNGEFPLGVFACTGLVSLNLSSNHLYGSIPSNISKLLPFVTSLNLSHNTFSGEISGDIANCSFLNVLMLNDNKLTGQIPAAIDLLPRLKIFTVANNRLVGAVPRFAGRYENNTGLCGGPLGPCIYVGKEVETNALVLGFLGGWGLSFFAVLVIGIFTPFWEYMINRIVLATPTLGLLLSNQRVHNPMISKMEKFATRISFLELKRTTNNFSKNNVISTGEMGTTYKVTLSNGYRLAIKRVSSSSPHTEHEFLTEIATLGRLRHRNLVPLLGFCHESNEKFLVYKFMPKGSLYDSLFLSDGELKMIGWPLMAKIAIGIARGIAWLHLNKVVHRGISSECILLDEDLNPRISDLRRATTLKHNNSSWEVSCNRESMELGSYEEDVHSFGKVLLELITRTEYFEIIATFDIDGDMFGQISGLLNKAGPAGACVRSMMGQGFDDEISLFLRVASKCLECDPLNWPSMEQVYQMLVGKAGDSAIDGLLKAEI